jgi:hypothetical protein
MKKAIAKGKQWIAKLFGAGARDSREESPAGSHPGREDSPAAPDPTLSPARNDITISDPSQVHRPDPIPEPRKIGRNVSDGLREKILACAFPRMSVEAEMVELCRTYRSSMPPCGLQLFAWGYPKGSPPRVVYWVRLSRKQVEFDHASLLPTQKKRPRWFKVLNIRTRADLHDAIHWNGLDKHRSTVMSFYDSRWALNKSHSLLAKGMQYVKLALKGHLESYGPGKEAPLDQLLDPSLKHLDGAGADLFVMAGQIGRLVDRNQIALEELQRRTTTLPFRLVLSEGPTEFDRVVEWEHAPSGRRCRILYEKSLKILQLPPQELAAVKLAVIECRGLLQTLSKQLKIIRGAESRLAKARRDSDQALERHTPQQRIPWVQGY